MSLQSDNTQTALPAAASKNVSLTLKLSVLLLIGGAVGFMVFLNHRGSVNSVLESGNCMAEEGVHEFFSSLKFLLHQAYRWIFKTCG
ncbi:hypothetical protein [Pantoea sp. C2G6]|uniref:hypothetical protein n=1 Tax=Pantoea sp. C2G6 TaxID=3243084 RepID=UPI003ED96F9E